MTLADLSTLALQVWQHARRERGATVWTVCDRLTRAGVFAEPREVSVACRELVRAGYARTSPLGYRARAERQIEMQIGGG